MAQEQKSPETLLQELLAYLNPSKSSNYNTNISTTVETDSQTPAPSSFGEAVLAKAREDLAAGISEDPGPVKHKGKRISKYFGYLKMRDGQSWCAAAVSAWMREAGGGPIAGSAGSLNIGHQFEQAGRFVKKKNIKPKDLSPGNVVVWSRGATGSGLGHVGIISSSSGRNFKSIEGNTGAGIPTKNNPYGTPRVMEKSHSIDEANLIGIGILSDLPPKPIKNPTANRNHRLVKIADIYCELANKIKFL